MCAYVCVSVPSSDGINLFHYSTLVLVVGRSYLVKVVSYTDSSIITLRTGLWLTFSLGAQAGPLTALAGRFCQDIRGAYYTSDLKTRIHTFSVLCLNLPTKAKGESSSLFMSYRCYPPSPPLFTVV